MKKVLGYVAAFLAGTLLSGGVALAATNMVQAEKGNSVIELDGSKISAPPKLVYGGTTYVQLYSIQQGLKQVFGTQPTWNGTTFNILANNTPEATVKTALSLIQKQQWDVLYSYLDPDVQAMYTEPEFVSNISINYATLSSVTNVSVQTATILPSWTDSTGTAKVYSNVAEVPFTLTLANGTSTSGTMHLVKVSDGSWRMFWSAS